MVLRERQDAVQHLYQDIEYLRECGAFLNGRIGLEHIGGWHSHHRLSLTHPSGGDVNTMQNALRDGNIPRFLISICNIEHNHRVSINGFLFRHNSTEDYLPCKWQILEGNSPIREKIEGLKTSLFIYPGNNSAKVDVQTPSQPHVDTVKKEIPAEKPELSEDSYWKKA